MSQLAVNKFEPSEIYKKMMEFKQTSGREWVDIARELEKITEKRFSIETIRQEKNYSAEVTEAVQTYLRKNQIAQKTYILTQHAGKFYESRVVRLIQQGLKIALEGKIVVMVGPAGIGKTFGLQEELKKYNAIFLTAFMGVGAKALAKEIAEALNIRIDMGATWKYIRGILNKLSDNRLVIAVDEANHLNLKVIETLRYIFDLANGNLGLFLIGTDRLRAWLDFQKGRSRLVDLEQFNRRIAWYVELPGFDDERVEEIIQERLGKVSSLVIQEIRNWIGPSGMVSIGRLESLLENIIRVSSGKSANELNPKDVQKAMLFLKA